MTREEKINILKAIIQECEEYQWWRKATLSEIIEDLEQETCEEQEPKYCDRNICISNEYNGIGCDECEVTKSQKPCDNCVSRADLIDKLEILDKRYGSDFYWEVRNIVDSLPPVTPTRKKGEWIYNKNESDLDYYAYNCSICGRQINFLYDSRQIKNYPYCHCGAKMESEE